MVDRDESKPPPGPWVMFVGIGDFVKRADGTAFDIVEITNTISVRRPTDVRAGGTMSITIHMLIMLLSDAIGVPDIVVRFTEPTGRLITEQHGIAPIDATGHLQVLREIDFAFTRAGRYYFDVYIENRWLARTSLQIALIGEEPAEQ